MPRSKRDIIYNARKKVKVSYEDQKPEIVQKKNQSDVFYVPHFRGL